MYRFGSPLSKNPASSPATNMYLPFTSGMPEFGSDGVRCFTKDDVRGRVDGFAGVDSVLGELLARTVK